MSSTPTGQKPRNPREDKEIEDWKDRGYGAKIAESASSARDYVGDKVSAIGDKLSDLKNTDIKEVAEQAKDYARQNPGHAILISAAAGLVLGMLIRGSRR
jgi:ElaB/YqjD/DUF883 family membrane-anchored ribosome-binding protein